MRVISSNFDKNYCIGLAGGDIENKFNAAPLRQYDVHYSCFIFS